MVAPTVEIDAVDRKAWSEVLGQFADASLYQTWDYAAVVFPRETASHMVLRVGDTVVALAQLRVVTAPLLKAGIAYVARGPLWRRQETKVNPEYLGAALRALREEYAIRRHLVLRIAPNERSDENLGVTEVLGACGFNRVHAVKAYQTFVLDLSRPLDEIRQYLSQNWRRNLCLGERNVPDVTESTSVEAYQSFLVLHRELRKRTRFQSGVDAERWSALQERLASSERICVFSAYRSGSVIAALGISALGDTGIYLLGATGESGLTSRASYVLQWRAAEWLQKRGCRAYDLGGIDPEQNPGVYQFKAGLRGERVSFVGTYECCDSALSRFLVSLGEGVRQARRRTRS